MPAAWLAPGMCCLHACNPFELVAHTSPYSGGPWFAKASFLRSGHKLSESLQHFGLLHDPTVRMGSCLFSQHEREQSARRTGEQLLSLHTSSIAFLLGWQCMWHGSDSYCYC